jgi:hypothetical protein
VNDSQKQELERFADGLMRLVRDRAIKSCDQLASGSMVGPDGDHWRSLVKSKDAKHALNELIPDIVDETLFQLLDAIDNEKLPLAWLNTEGMSVPFRDLGLGEMGGWLMGSPGWRHEYSSERFFDPLKDLHLESDE